MEKLSHGLVTSRNMIRYESSQLPERVLQFGEGNFLRGFIDWMIQQMNKQNVFNGRVVVIQPTPHGKVVPKLQAQDSLYTVWLRGIADGETVDHHEVITSISRGINPYTDWKDVLEVAASPDISVVFSNTTEAGLTYLEEGYDKEKAPLSFPGKLAACLWHRYETLGRGEGSGLVIIPCELVEQNGKVLKELVCRYAKAWNFPQEFFTWLERENEFCHTLVDRIVPGFPSDTADECFERLGYEDILLTVAEPYHLFIIEGSERVRKLLPFNEAGLHVRWNHLEKHRNMKVRVLNGTHTFMFALSYLSGVDTVGEAMADEQLCSFIRKGLFEEILPCVDAPEQEVTAFVETVLERFENPFLQHRLTDIGLNAVNKFRTRLMPTFNDYVAQTGEAPTYLLFSLAALINYYRGVEEDGPFLIGRRREDPYLIRDDLKVIEAFKVGWQQVNTGKLSLAQLCENLLSKRELWGVDLSMERKVVDKVAESLQIIVEKGMRQAISGVLNQIGGNNHVHKQ
ncbi:tagaturonate reductase [Halalkalibacterium halodurans]|uniref:tagaturonate reductase n=1 Tax=Halalkalibacterium halodurans TaxID=86665 RepID=UPI002E1D0C7A|nr:tagaturonate reductase [Halalkalibacterium halodurans]MED4161231.1 tagaturonate reductase [Halalkalibacterium halodurans]